MSVDVVAKHLGITRETAYRGIDAKGLGCPPVGRLWKFKLTQVEAGGANGGLAADTQRGGGEV